MHTHQPKRTPTLCAHWREDDGLDPSLESRRRDPKTARKDQQLSKQAHRALSLFLEGECRHPDLADIVVLSVDFEATSQRLCVSVAANNDNSDGEAVLAALRHSQSLLRSVVAASLHRKKVPTLSFHYVGALNTGGEPCPFKP